MGKEAPIMARGFFRKTSFWKTVGAFRSQWKRALKRFFLPGYGKKGMGWWRNPKKAFYNWWYHRTSVSIPRLLGYKPSRGACILALTMACFLNVFAAPFDVAKAATKAHRIKKARKARAASANAKKRTSSSGEHLHNPSSTVGSTTSDFRSATKRETVDKTRTSYSSTRTTSAGTTTKGATNKNPDSKKVYSPAYVAPEDREETKAPVVAPYERIRLFEPVEPKVVVEQAPVEPDENTPKSTPKNEKDQFIRKRMIIAGSSYCDKAVLEKLKVGTYFVLEAEPDNSYDKDAVMLVYEGEKIGYIAKQDRLAFVTCLKLKRNIYGVITAIKEDEFPVKYEFETWFDNSK